MELATAVAFKRHERVNAFNLVNYVIVELHITVFFTVFVIYFYIITTHILPK